jgi:hypothetical protein
MLDTYRGSINARPQLSGHPLGGGKWRSVTIELSEVW